MARLLFEGESSERCDKLTGFVTDHSPFISEIDPFSALHKSTVRES